MKPFLQTQKQLIYISISICIILFLPGKAFSKGDTKPNEEGPIPGLYVNTYTGNMFYERNDLFIPGRNLSLDISFFYNSGRSNEDWGYGNGWSSSFSIHYYRAGDNIIIENNDGRQDEYRWDGFNFIPPAGIHNTLTEYQEGKIMLATHHGYKYYFDDQDHRKVTAIEDRNGNSLSFSYSDGFLTLITDTSGKTYDLEWEEGHLLRIIDNNTETPRTLTYQYDETGNMIMYTDPLGNSWAYAYDKSLMTGITNPKGFSIIVNYDNNNALSTFSQASSGYLMSLTYNAEDITTTVSRQFQNGLQTLVYYFDDIGRVIKKEFDGGSSVLYEWDDFNNIIAYTDQNGNRHEQEFDDHGNITLRRDPAGNETLYEYEPVFHLFSKITDKLGNNTIYEYDSHGNLVKVTDAEGNYTEYSYNGFGQVTERTDRNNHTWNYTNSDSGYILQKTDPEGNSTSFTYDKAGNKLSYTSPAGLTTNFEYDLNNNLLSVEYPDGNITAYSYDPLGNKISETDQNGHTAYFVYDQLNRLHQVTDRMNNTIDYSYDPLGNRISYTDQNGNITTYTYDALNRLISETDPLGNTIEYTYDNCGNLISLEDRNGNITNYSYDPLNRLINVTDALGAEITNNYDAEGNLIAKTDKKGNNTYFLYNALHRLVKIIDPMGHVTLYYYDAAGNITFRSDPNEIVHSYSYDALNRLVSETIMSGPTTSYTYDESGNVLTMTDPLGNTTTYSYDELGRLISETDPMGYISSYSYDPLGNKLTETDKNGNVTQYSYDPLNRLIASSDALGNINTYSYDPVGNRISVTDANGNTVSYSYDANNRLSAIGSPMGHNTEYQYDASGNILSRSDPRGIVTDYEYDALNRLVGIDYPTGSVEKSYDPPGNLIEMKNTGIGINDRTQREYDNAGRMISETISYGAFSKTVNYGYDPGGRLTQVIYPDGTVLHREFNNYNDLVGSDFSLTGPAVITRDAIGNNTQTLLPNSESNISTYDTFNRLTSRTTSDPEGSELFSHNYEYDGVGNLLQADKNGLPGATYTYDALNRVKTANYPWVSRDESYAYDQAGNRIVKSINGDITSYSYNSENKVTKQTMPDMSEILYSYDSNGNIIQTSSSWGIVNYTYDYENRLTGITYPQPFGTVKNHYTPDGIRIAREENGIMKFYLPTLLGNILEMDGAGNILVKINPGINLSRITPGLTGTPGLQNTFIHWGSQNSTTEFTSEGIEASFEFGYFGSILTSTGDIENVEAGLYSSLMKVDWDPLVGAELIGGDYAPDIDQNYSNHDYYAEGQDIDFGPGSDPFEGHVYNIYFNDREEFISYGYSAGRDPYDRQNFPSGWDFFRASVDYVFGPEDTDNTPGTEGRGTAASNKETELCNYIWYDWETTGTFWKFIRAYRANSFAKKIMWLFELKRNQKQWQNICLLEKGHPAHHRKSVRNATGKTRVASYTPPKYKKIYSPSIPGAWPSQDWINKKGKELEEDLNK